MRTGFVQLLAVGLLLAAAPDAFAETLRAGAGRVLITPEPDEFPYVVPHERNFVGVHDDLYARALILDDGRARAVIVSVEVTAIPHPNEVVKAVAAAAHVPASSVLVTATHTHSVPLAFYHGEITNPSQALEMERLEKGAVSAVKTALANLRPARIAWARGEAHVNTNNGEESGRKGWFDPAASSDKSLDVVRIVDLTGKPVAAVIDYASHAEVMFRSVTKDGGYEVTGDLPGATMRLLEQQPAAAPVVLYLAGAEGDQLPLFKSLQPEAELPASDLGSEGWGLLDAQARRLASAALDTIASMPPGDANVRIAVDQETVSCPGQHYEVERPGGKVIGVRDTPPVAIPLTTIHINDFALASVGADLASEIGRSIKSRSPVAHTTIVTMQAGSIGYVLNDAAYEHPGHGALGSPVKPGCAPAALSGTVAKLLDGHGK